MPSLVDDRTAEFQSFIRVKQPRGASPPSHVPREDNWTKQAEQVNNQLMYLSKFLASVRKAYLDLSTTSMGQQPRALDTSKGIAAFEGVKWLTDRERDEIDYAFKVLIRKSVDRIRELERAEQVRRTKETQEYNKHEGALSRLLNKSSQRSIPSSESLSAHRSLITLYLNGVVISVSGQHREQQETRIKRQLEKTASLGSANSTAMNDLAAKQAEHDKRAKALNSDASLAVPDLYKPVSADVADPLDPEGPALDTQLTQEQITQFEKEENALLESTQTDLASLKKAESSLLEISSMQTQLALHLSQQVELTDKMWDDAITVTGKMQDGNVELKKARERNKEGRTWLVVLIVMASFSLLFLDYLS